MGGCVYACLFGAKDSEWANKGVSWRVKSVLEVSVCVCMGVWVGVGELGYVQQQAVGVREIGEDGSGLREVVKGGKI